MRAYLSLSLTFVVTALFSAEGQLFSAPDQPIPSFPPQTGFIENKGQVIDQKNKLNPAVLYLLNTPGMNVQLRKAGFSYDLFTPPLYPLPQEGGAQFQIHPPLPSRGKGPGEGVKLHRIDFDLLNFNPDCEIITSEPSSWYFNYYTTGTPVNGIRKVHSFDHVTYINIYPNIDLEFLLDENRNWKYNFIIHPGGNFEDIRIRIQGPDLITEESGHLSFFTSAGEVNEVIPGSFEINECDTTSMNFLFRRLAPEIFGFCTKDTFDPGSRIVIDPSTMRRWGSYYGAGGMTRCQYLSSPLFNDKDGNIIFGGETNTFFNLATAGSFQDSTGGAIDGFFAKFTTNSQLLWGTYYGGTDWDFVTSVTADRASNIYVAGITENDTIFATPGAHQTVWIGPNWDAFLSKFSPDGFRIWSTYYGGYGSEDCGYVATDRYCNVYLSGETEAYDNISTPGSWQPVSGDWEDAFLVKLDSSGVRLWGTYYGGSEGDFNNACTCDTNGNVFITGFTNSLNNIASPGAYQTVPASANDAYLAGFNTSGIRLWGTYYGGTQNDMGNSCKIDNDGNIIMAGQTKSPDGIASPGAFQTSPARLWDGFLVKFNFAGQRLWATYYGSTEDDVINSCSFGTNGDIFIAGSTNSDTGISTPGSFMPVFGGYYDGFLVKFDSAGARKWATYYGGTDYEDGNACSYVKDDTIYLYGSTISSAGISTPNGYQYTYPGGWDAFLVQMIECWPIPPAQAITGPVSVCQSTGGFTYTISALPHAVIYGWTLPPGATITNGDSTTSVTVNFSSSAVSGKIWVKGFNKCDEPGDSAFLDITVHPRPVASISGVDTLCRFDTTTFTTQPGMSNYLWSVSPSGTITSGGGLSDNTAAITWNATGANWVTVNYTNTFGCIGLNPGQHNVWIKQEGPALTTNPLFQTICSDDSVHILLTATQPGTTFSWTAWGSSGNVSGYFPGSGNSIDQKLINSGILPETVTYHITPFGNGCPGISRDYVVTVDPKLPVSISISSSANPSCQGQPVTFTATPVNGGILPIYQWKVNGIIVGGNSPVYTYTPANGDVVICVLTSSEICTSVNPVTSSPVIMVINSNLIVGVTIGASVNPVCSGIPVTFTATPVNGGALPIYQWKVNGIIVGTNSPVYTYTPVNGDVVICVLTSSETCTSSNPVTSSPVIMVINSAPVVTFSKCNDTITTTNAKPFVLKGGIPLGGTYSGPGVNPATGIFNPAAAGVGNKTITYTYINSALCSVNSTRVYKVVNNSFAACGLSLVDVRDNQTYQTVQIGSQCWIAENLNYGTEIPDNIVQRDNCVPERYRNPASSIQHPASVYQWDELMQYTDTPGQQGLCPPAWHVPTEAEWQTLLSFYNGPGFAASPLLSTGFSGFNAEVNGSRFQNSSWDFTDFATHFWTSTAWGPVKAWAHAMNNVPDDHSVSTYPASRANAFTVRCVKD